MSDSTSTHMPRGKKRAVFWFSCDVLFGMVGPVFLSIYYAGEFRPRRSPSYWSHYYPWAFPIWAFGITFVKVLSLAAWLGLRSRAAAGISWLAGLLAGVFLVGAGHALACAIVNSEGFGAGLWFALTVALAYLAALSYSRNFVLALRWGRASKVRLILGLLLGLILGAALPGAADLLVFGKPW